MDWRAQANCLNKDPELFFPAGPHTDERPAKHLCAACPVITQCREWALAHQPHGIAGGLNEHERRELRREPGIAQPGPSTPGEITTAGRAALLQGLSTRQIQREFCVSERTVQRWARQQSVRRSAPA